MRGRWGDVIILWATGVLAAAQLGKTAVLMSGMRVDFGLSLAVAGLMISLIEAGGGTFGSVAGLIAGRFHARSVLAAGLALLAGAGFLSAAAPTIAVLFAARLVESVGYLLVVVAAPSLIAVTAEGFRAPALALWSTFFPAGLALGTVFTGALVDHVDRSAILALWAGGCLFVVPICLRLPPVPGMRGAGFSLPPRSVVLCALGFGAFTVIEGGVLALLPTYLGEVWSLDAVSAGTITGVASAVTPLGGWLAARLSRRWSTGALFAFGLLASALLFAPGYPPPFLGGRVSVVEVSVLIVLGNALCGVVAATAFMRMPELLKAAGAPLSAMTAANGVFAQCGALGSLIGPPAIGWAAGSVGWWVVGPIAVVLSLLSLGLFMAAECDAAVAGFD